MQSRSDKWIVGLLDKWGNVIHPSKNPSIQKSLHPTILALLCVLVAGCAGYKLGPTNGLIAGDRSVQITPFLNHTFEPRLGDAVTTAVRQDIQRDGTYRLATRGDADIVVTGVLSKYTRHELNFEPHDVLTVRDFRVSVVAQYSARDAFTGNTKSWTNTVYTLVRVGNDLTSAERQAMPVLAEQLAKTVTDSLVDGTW
jgi:hypothetical protein